MWFGHDQFSKTELPGRHMASVQNRFYWPDGRVSFLPNGNLEHCRHALMGSSVAGLRFAAQSVTDFYVAVVAGLADLRIKVKIGEWPNEVPDPIRFGEDRTHAAYDPEYARRFWRILLQVDRLFKLLVQPRAFLLGQFRF